MSSFPQRCKVCGCRSKIDFYVSDDTWEAVVPEPFRKRVVCLSCFDAFAAQRGVSYADSIIGQVLFVGDAADFELDIAFRLARPE